MKWSEVLSYVRPLAAVIPGPIDDVALDLAIALARVMEARGCSVDNCPAEVRAMLPANLPTGDRGQQAMVRAEAAARGLVK